MADENKGKSYGGGSGSTTGYTVELRTTFPEPSVHPLGFIIDNEWRKVPFRIAVCDRSDHNNFQSGKIGEIPVFNWSHELTHLGLVNFDAAYALAVQLQAQVWNGSCIQTRIVEVRVNYTYSTEEKGVGAPISLSDLERAYRTAKREAKATETV